MISLWLTTVIPRVKPPRYNESSSYISPAPSQLTLLYSSFALMSIGVGGIRPCSLSFGADQLSRPENPNNDRVLQSFFSWYYASFAALLTTVIVIVYIQDYMGWKVGFGVVAIFLFSATSLYFLDSSLYIKVKANTSLLIEFARVIVAVVKNKHLASPPKS
eukprot:TRINITY_DN1846_c0_g1_i4.p1 TRINITY_DN1846_c0_g1~~TRINITY_DN1846_c0_g1_i4.p1  ORF type:complete len:161 (-),score=20.26 TRINITY_DN1846_c0_g1_i4:221-703(-)